METPENKKIKYKNKIIQGQGSTTQGRRRVHLLLENRGKLIGSSRGLTAPFREGHRRISRLLDRKLCARLLKGAQRRSDGDLTSGATPFQLSNDILGIMDIGLVSQQLDVVVGVQVVDIQAQALTNLRRPVLPVLFRQG